MQGYDELTDPEHLVRLLLAMPADPALGSLPRSDSRDRNHERLSDSGVLGAAVLLSRGRSAGTFVLDATEEGAVCEHPGGS